MLNFIGLPLLYRVVDLTGYPTSALGRVWKICFGEEGLFSEPRGDGQKEDGREGEVHRRKVGFESCFWVRLKGVRVTR